MVAERRPTIDRRPVPTDRICPPDRCSCPSSSCRWMPARRFLFRLRDIWMDGTPPMDRACSRRAWVGAGVPGGDRQLARCRSSKPWSSTSSPASVFFSAEEEDLCIGGPGPADVTPCRSGGPRGGAGAQRVPRARLNVHTEVHAIHGVRVQLQVPGERPERQLQRSVTPPQTRGGALERELAVMRSSVTVAQGGGESGA